jgi:two-component system, LytTR family, response regulator AlgR
LGTSLGVRPTVVVADDHPGMLAEIFKFLQPHCQIVAAVENGILAVQAISEWRPDIAILDIAMPGMTGIEAAQRLCEMKSSTSIIFLTMQPDADYVQAADAVGAGVVLKSRMRSDLLLAIETALGYPVARQTVPPST